MEVLAKAYRGLTAELFASIISEVHSAKEGGKVTLDGAACAC